MPDLSNGGVLPVNIIMSTDRLEKLSFPQLEVSGVNYIPWAANVKDHLIPQDLDHCVADDFNPVGEYKQEGAKALIFIRKHLSSDLQNEYLT